MMWAQLVGVLGIVILLAIFQFNDRRTILRLQLISGIVWAMHFFLLGALTGAFMNLLMSGRNYLFDRYGKNQKVFWVSMAVIVVAGIVTWRDWSSTLPLVASVIGTVAMWQKNPRTIRFMMLVVPILWFGYNFLNGSYPGMVGDSVTLCSLLIGVYRFDIRKQASPAPPAAQTIHL